MNSKCTKYVINLNPDEYIEKNLCTEIVNTENNNNNTNNSNISPLPYVKSITIDDSLDLDHKNKNKKNDISFKEDMILLCNRNWKIKKMNILKNIWTKI